MKKLTLEEIGKLAGVSRATVSRVVNGYPHIRPDIRERVEEVIRATGFRPNAIARSLASNRSNMIGLIVPSIVENVFNDPYFPSLIQGVAKACGRYGKVLALYLINNLQEQRGIAENLIGSSMVDGLILGLGEYNLERMLTKSSIPFVTIGQPRNTALVPYVDVDNFMGAYLATKHLLELGHRRIGMIAVNNHTAGENRFRGYQSALTEFGVGLDESLVAAGDFSYESAYGAIQKILPQKPSAVFISSDRMALGAMQWLKEQNIKVPDDVAIVGFDNLGPALVTEPALTTVRQDVEGLGTASVNLLLDLIEAVETRPENIILPIELIVRESSGAKYSGARA